MKIAHVVCTFPPYYGGMGNVAYEMALGLIAKGHEVVVYTPDFGEQSKESFEVARYLKPRLKYGNAARLSALGRELAKFDLVHLHYPFFGTANIVRKWKLRNPSKPLVVTYHMDTRAPGWKGLVFSLYAKFWMPKILSAADAVIGSTFDYIENSDARKIFLENKNKWHEIPFGVDTERFKPAPKPEEIFFGNNLNPQAPTLLFVGGMDIPHAFKGIPILLQAVKILQKDFADIQLVLVGDGEERKTFELLAQGMGIKNRVFFAGRVSHEDLPQYYHMADLFVLPSIHQGEAFGMVLLEAMGSGVPVVASNIPGVRTIAEQAGITVVRKNPQVLAQAIGQYLNLSLREQQDQRSHARQVALLNFSWDKIIQKTEDLYATLFASGKKM